MQPYDDLLFVPPAPVAKVVIRHPDRQQSIGDVPMLIDRAPTQRCYQGPR